MNQISQYFVKNPKKRNLNEKVVHEVTLMKLIFLREALSQLTFGNLYLTV